MKTARCVCRTAAAAAAAGSSAASTAISLPSSSVTGASSEALRFLSPDFGVGVSRTCSLLSAKLMFRTSFSLLPLSVGASPVLSATCCTTRRLV
eukprot:COSAG06_NODE_1320_length_9872_cov_49.877213_17_plen_94_part_00